MEKLKSPAEKHARRCKKCGDTMYYDDSMFKVLVMRCKNTQCDNRERK